MIKGKPILVLDTRRQITTGENKDKYHVKLRVSLKSGTRSVHRFYPTGVYAFTTEDVIRYQVNPKKSESGYQKVLLAILTKAKSILEENPDIDPEMFSHKLTAKGSYLDPLAAMESYEAELRENDQVGTADYYGTALSAWRRFVDEKLAGHLTFAMVTPKVLQLFEKWLMAGETGMKKQKDGTEKEVVIRKQASITTVGMYTIAMRTIFNLPNIKKKLPPAMYPFGKDKDKYQIPRARGRKLALTEAQKNVILNYKAVGEMRRAVDMWIFSYFCNGMNFADIARLKYGHIRDGILIFERTKSIRKRDKAPIVITLRQECLDIVAAHGKGNPKDMNDYIFGVIAPGMTAAQIKHRVHHFVRDTNELLNSMCKAEGLPEITTYWARHTFATIAKQKGVSLAEIQEALGHADPKTTEAYLDRFDIESKRKISNLL